MFPTYLITKDNFFSLLMNFLLVRKPSSSSIIILISKIYFWLGLDLLMIEYPKTLIFLALY